MLEGFAYAYIEKFEKLALAVSGGKDSMAMLNAFLKSVDKDKFFVVTVHHNLRGDEGKRDRDFVVEFCQKNNLECLVYEEDIPTFCADNKYTVEQGARIRRRQIFKDLVDSRKAQRVVTAHHLSDNVESILMHIFRGSGLKGLCGMSLDDGALLRPMLDCTRESIDEYIEKCEIPYVEDSTNASVDYTRNRLRREIIPLIKSVYGGLDVNVARLSQRAEEIWQYIDGFCSNFRVLDGEVLIPIRVFDKEDAIVAQTVINAVDSITSRVDLTSKHIEAIRALKGKQSGASVALPFNLKAHRQSDCVALAFVEKKEYSGIIDGYGDYDLGDRILTISKEYKDGLVCDLDKLKGSVIRNRRQGDNFKRYKGGSKSLGDYFTDKKVPKRLRDNVVVVAKESVVYLLPEYEISDYIKVDDSTINKAYISIRQKGDL
ncbi:MAG: tRNA lysidine(34) synthetase TilS [Clostridiales bacterium]|nr:tRNA lysidine(34) synthetase TilS [Clostridiales bacterium]